MERRGTRGEVIKGERRGEVCGEEEDKQRGRREREREREYWKREEKRRRQMRSREKMVKIGRRKEMDDRSGENREGGGWGQEWESKGSREEEGGDKKTDTGRNVPMITERK